MEFPDAARWNARYDASEPPRELSPPQVVSTHLADVGGAGSALDVACGWGDSGLYLATLGASVTLADVSEVALAAARARAAILGVSVDTITTDLAADDIPGGPWDVITCAHYLDRQLLPRLAQALSPNGRLVCAIATITNLERHERPSARFLLERDELATLVPTLDVIHHSEEWRDNGVHEAWLVARATR